MQDIGLPVQVAHTKRDVAEPLNCMTSPFVPEGGDICAMAATPPRLLLNMSKCCWKYVRPLGVGRSCAGLLLQVSVEGLKGELLTRVVQRYEQSAKGCGRNFRPG